MWTCPLSIRGEYCFRAGTPTLKESVPRLDLPGMWPRYRPYSSEIAWRKPRRKEGGEGLQGLGRDRSTMVDGNTIPTTARPHPTLYATAGDSPRLQK